MLGGPTLERDIVRTEKVMSEFMTGAILPRSFYRRGTVAVARDLLGKVLVHGATAGIIVETEAYPGGDDVASHSAVGITNRTRVIFGPPGHAYVYLLYGMHACMNVVVGPEGTGGCVLIRALEPVAGLEIMRERRMPARGGDRQLASGPGKLARALGITLQEYGADLTRGDLVVRRAARLRPFAIAATARIGITKCVDRPLRFLIRGNPFVSRAERSRIERIGLSKPG
jgi:DNA-3-methyladenine glycosylase